MLLKLQRLPALACCLGGSIRPGGLGSACHHHPMGRALSFRFAFAGAPVLPGPLGGVRRTGCSLDGGRALSCSRALAGSGALPVPLLKQRRARPVREAIPSDTHAAACRLLWHQFPLFLLPSGLSRVTGLRDIDPEGHLLIISKTEVLKNIFKLPNFFKS